MKEVKEIEKLPKRLIDEEKYIYRKKGKPHFSEKTHFTIYCICLKCPKMLEWKSKSLKTNIKKKENNTHSCTLT